MTAGFLKPRYALAALVVAAGVCAALLTGGPPAKASPATAASVSVAGTPPSTATANPYARYKRCKNIRFRKRHYRVVKLRMRCKPARRNTRYVLRKRKPPRGWTCSMPNLPVNGVCSQKRQRFAFRLV